MSIHSPHSHEKPVHIHTKRTYNGLYHIQNPLFHTDFQFLCSHLIGELRCKQSLPQQVLSQGSAIELMEEDTQSPKAQYQSQRRKFKSQQSVTPTQEYRKLVQLYDSARKSVKSLMRERK